jgi:MFS family permease
LSFFNDRLTPERVRLCGPKKVATILTNRLKRQRRPFYGWLIVGIGFLGWLVFAGVSADVPTVLLKPMSEGLGWTRTATIGVTALAAVVSAAVSPLFGRIVDRHGARTLMAASAVVGGALVAALSLVYEPWHFYLLFGIGLGLIRPGLASVTATTAVSNWFVKKRGRALAISSMGAGVSALGIIPLTQYVVTSFHWRAAWLMLAIMSWVLLALPAALIVRRRPEDMGLVPDGEATGNAESLVVPQSHSNPTSANPAGEVDWASGEALRTRAFWLVLASVSLTALPLMGLWLHAVSNFADRGIAPTAAALAVSSLAITSLPFRLFWGFLAERLSVRYCLVIVNFGSVVAVVLIMLATSFTTACAAMMFWGVFVGGSMALQALVWPEYFGRLALGTIQGYAQLFQVVGIAGGPVFAGLIFDTTGSYTVAFVTFAAAYFLAALIMFIAKEPLLPKHPTAAEKTRKDQIVNVNTVRRRSESREG